MPHYNTIIKCFTDNGKAVSILPQSELMLFEGRMFNVNDAEDFGFNRLVRLYKRDYEFHVTVYPQQVLSFDGMSLITERCVKIVMYKYGQKYRHTFLGVCFRDCVHNPMSWYSSHYIIYYDNRTWKWKYIQKFLRTQLERWKAGRRLALAMAFHKRLGSQSMLNCMPLDLMVKFIPF